MKKNIWTVFLFLLTLPLFGQWDMIDLAVQNIPPKKEKSIALVCEYIKENASNDFEKARGAYYWISNNIKYDAKKYFKGEPSYSKPEEVFKERRAVCLGYSTLFREMCLQMNIQCNLISGWPKSMDSNREQTLYESTHAWNAIKIGNDWHLVDVTWASGEVHKRLFKKFVPKFYDNYFDVNPKEFILSHLPEIPMWQLLEHPISIKLFSSDDKIHAYLKNPPTSENFHYNDTIQMLLPFTENSLKYGLMALRFNPLNPLPLACFKQISLMKKFNTKSHKKNSYNYSDFSYDEIDSVINLADAIILSLKNSKFSQKSASEVANSLIAWSYDKLSEIHLTKSEKKYNDLVSLKIQTVDSISLYAKAVIKSLSSSLQSNLKIVNSEQFNTVCKTLYEKNSWFLASYTDYLKNEKDKSKQKIIQREIGLLVQEAKKNIPSTCPCYPKVQTW